MVFGEYFKNKIDNAPKNGISSQSITQQSVVYYQPNKQESLRKKSIPPFAHLDKGFYVVPTQGVEAIKIASHIPGVKAEGNFENESVKQKFLTETRKFLQVYLPEMKDAKVIDSKVRYYDMTPDSNFILDHLNENIVVGAGFSGHAFKFAPLVGEILSDLILNKISQQDISRFQLKRFS